MLNVMLRKYHVFKKETLSGQNSKNSEGQSRLVPKEALTRKTRGTSHLDTEESSTRTDQHDAAANEKHSLIFYSTACGQFAPVFDSKKTTYFSLAK